MVSNQQCVGLVQYPDALNRTNMHGEEIYQLWEDFRVQSKSKKPISKVSLKQYKVAWGKWLFHCAGRAFQWAEATPDEVQHFIDGIKPRSSRSTADAASKQTQKRYWRTLYDIYEFAVIFEHTTRNPANLPRAPDTVEVKSLALPPDDWNKLSDCLPAGHSPRDCRNRITLLLAMRAALTVAELTRLTIDDLNTVDRSTFTGGAAESDLPLFQPESPHWQANEPHPVYSITITSATPARRRTLVLDERTSKAMYDWLNVRHMIRKNPPASSTVGNHLLSTSDGLKPMDAKAIYNVCKAHFLAALGTDTSIQHLGPNTLRNTCIKIWHQRDVSDAEIKRRLGLKADGALRRLQNHFTQSQLSV